MLLITLIFYTGLYSLFLIFPKLSDSHINFLLTITPIYLVYGILVFYIIKKKKLSFFLFLLSFLFITLVFMPKVSILSNDIYRYFWDGMLTVRKINPYLYVPQDIALSQIHNTSLYNLLDWKNLITPYPPLAQLIFIPAHILYSNFGLGAGKLVFAFPIFILCILMYKLGYEKLSIILLLNPLVLSEVVYSGHTDGWVMLFTFISLYSYLKKNYLTSFIFITLGFLTKVYPALIVPFYIVDLLRKKDFRNVIMGLATFILLSFLSWYPFVRNSVTPIIHYLTLPDEQEFNASIYRYSYQIIGSDSTETKTIAKFIGLGFFSISYLYLLLKPFSPNLLSISYLALLLGSSIVFPWYTLFFIPPIFLFIKKSKNYKLLIPLLFMQFTVTWIYFEPGKRNVRDLMLNVEYILLLASVIYYKKILQSKLR